MTVDLLSLKIKEAKRELTALKTTHKRGLGMLKTFVQEITFTTPHEGFVEDGTMVVDFSREFAPYPFAYVLGYAQTNAYWFVISAEIESVSYSNDGYTIRFNGSFLYDPGYVVNKIKLISTSMPTSINFEWSN